MTVRNDTSAKRVLPHQTLKAERPTVIQKPKPSQQIEPNNAWIKWVIFPQFPFSSHLKKKKV